MELMIDYSHKGYAKEALSLFHEMQLEKIMPDSIDIKENFKDPYLFKNV